MRLQTVPLERSAAVEFVDKLHRHHEGIARDKFRIGAALGDQLVGVVQVGRPTARVLCDGKTLEVIRLCSDGTPHVCSFLYGAAARVARELGYSRIVTYILASEPGTSLRAAGWLRQPMFEGSPGTRRAGQGTRQRRPAIRNDGKKY